MRVLAIEPYYGGSHRAFLDSWIDGSRHQWTLLTLPPYKWKWRMRHGAITFAEEVAKQLEAGAGWDLLFCSDMLNLAEFRGLAPPAVGRLPAVGYFHENQLTYPVQYEKERDLHFGITNLTTALAATAVWFNSAYHRDTFLAAIPDKLLKRMPDYQPFAAVERIRSRSAVYPQGIGRLPSRGPRRTGPLRILWAARWEFDKNPEAFFEALEILHACRVPFRVSVIGEQFKRVPEVFATARESFREQIDLWGHQPSREDYERALTAADVIVSTANHEFFGISVVEAIAAGCYPLLPNRLVYPEIVAGFDDQLRDECLYDGSPRQLAEKLAAVAERVAVGDLWQGDAQRGIRAVAGFSWPQLRPRLDDALEALFRHHSLQFPAKAPTSPTLESSPRGLK
ncbi:MAG: DUF3524 domain-containing protein [bacterium]|nr:DUF3524 domain-containing protein [bacterium]